MRIIDYQYYEGLIWQKLKAEGLQIRFEDETNEFWSLQSVISQYAGAILDGMMDFTDAVWKSREWHKCLVEA